jgi:hypothetical protein
LLTCIPENAFAKKAKMMHNKMAAGRGTYLLVLVAALGVMNAQACVHLMGISPDSQEMSTGHVLIFNVLLVMCLLLQGVHSVRRQPDHPTML